MYNFFYNNGVSDIEFFPLIDSFSIKKERMPENPFIIRNFIDCKLNVTANDFAFFEAFKGTSSEINGKIIETINSNTTNYNCKFKINSEINYSTKFLSIEVLYRDKYYNLLDNPEKSIDKKYNLKKDFSTLTPKVIRHNNSISLNKEGGAYLVKQIIYNILLDLDVDVIIDDDSFINLDSNSYNVLAIADSQDLETVVFASFKEVTEFDLLSFFTFLGFESGLHFFWHLTDLKEFRITQLNDLFTDNYLIDLTNYNSFNWAAQKQLNIEIDPKNNLIRFENNFNSIRFRNIDCIFPKNIINKQVYSYNYLVDFSKALTEKKGLALVNTYTNLEYFQSFYTNVGLSNFSQSDLGSGNWQIAGEAIGIDKKYCFLNFSVLDFEEIELNWNELTGSDATIEFYNTATTQTIAVFDVGIGNNSINYIFENSGAYEIRIVCLSGAAFNITDFSFNLVKYIIKNDIFELILTENYHLAPKYITSNFLSFMPDSEGFVDGVFTGGFNVKPYINEEVEFSYNNLFENFPFDNYVKTEYSENMIPYTLERTVLSADSKGLDKISLKTR